jgi:phosphoglycolate phosphatase-like HAD superfamily hydrolase
MPFNQDILINFKPKHDFFIGCDSDGCALDTMEIKQKECFCPNTIKHWELQAISKYAREVSEFVNLYSKWRGGNRFPSLVKVFDLLAERDEVKARGFQPPELQPLKEWIASGSALGNATLQEAAARTGDPILRRTLAWSEAVNQTIAEIVYGIPTFPFVKESLAKLTAQADLICVSQTPIEAIEREWGENDIAGYAAIIAGQELGTKTEHLKLAAVGKYPADHILMVGDALGDLEAARGSGALFYPINPGCEEASWRRFHDEALDRFFNTAYAGDYEAGLIREFESYLPETPPWRKQS